MSEKDKNIINELSDFLRYQGKKLTDKERNAFERELQKDPFASEASDGYDEIDPKNMTADISELQKRLKKRTSGKQNVLWYRIAASVAVLMILTSIFIIIEMRKPADKLAYSPSAAPQPSREVPVKQDQEKIAGVSEKQDLDLITKEKKKEVSGEAKKNELKDDNNKEVQEEVVPANIKADEQISKAEEPEAAMAKGRAMAVKTDLVRRTQATYSIVRGRILSSEDNKPIPGASITVKGTRDGTVTDTGGNFSLAAEEARNNILVASFVGMESKEFKALQDSGIEIKLQPAISALNEIVVVGYGAKGNETDKEYEATGYTPPQPVNGKVSFEKYIQNQIRRPDTVTAGQRVVVVLNFIVDPDGKIDSLKVIRSPGKLFSDEAIRLIKEGPAWKPAEQNGKVISDEVRIRIVFK
jgi:TonB family protein